jgi:hypothetical protein
MATINPTSVPGRVYAHALCKVETLGSPLRLPRLQDMAARCRPIYGERVSTRSQAVSACGSSGIGGAALDVFPTHVTNVYNRWLYTIFVRKPVQTKKSLLTDLPLAEGYAAPPTGEVDTRQQTEQSEVQFPSSIS